MKILLIAIFIILTFMPSGAAEWRKSDVRFPQLVQKNSDTVEIGNGMIAAMDGETIVVNIPGTFLDSLTGYPTRPLTLQLAAAALVNVCNTDARTGSEAIDKLYKGSKEVRQGSGQVLTEYLFRLKNKRYTNIFVYLNDITGIVAVIKIPKNK